MERRLAATLAADAVGYSRLMGEDETGRFTALKALRKELFAPKVAEHHGRIVKLVGDGALVEFPTIVDAVERAAAVLTSRSLPMICSGVCRFRGILTSSQTLHRARASHWWASLMVLPSADI